MIRRLFLALSMLSLLAVAAPAAQAEDARISVEKARIALENILGDPNYAPYVKPYLAQAKGVMIVPSLVKAGLIVGGEAGNAVVVVKDPQKGWSDPAFYLMAAGSIGLQIGVEAKEILFILRTEKAVNSLLSTQAKLGADVSVTAGTVGAGAKAGSVGSLDADMVAFSKSQGLFGGGSIDGAVITPRSEAMEQYYGTAASPKQVLIERRFTNDHAAGLKAALSAN
jgi:lipid-binding SYLF domain-containing protein